MGIIKFGKGNDIVKKVASFIDAPLTTKIMEDRRLYFESKKEEYRSTLLQEIEIYKAVKTQQGEVKSFDPRASKSCFMGQGFQMNGEFVDADLVAYRKAVGTIPHPIWGEATILEIWGGSHFTKYKQMVSHVYEYAMGMDSLDPDVVHFYIDPFSYSEELENHSSDFQRTRELMEKGVFFEMGITQEAYERSLRKEAKS